MWRRLTQVVSTAITNPHLPSLLARTIYGGRLKAFCVPSLNCYSCPMAVFACPIGAIQNIFAQVRPSVAVGKYYVGLYVIGILGVVGSAVGRMACGWICPFGMLQELIHKIPSPKIQIPRFLSYFKYVILLVAVIILPLMVVDAFGYGDVWFCKYLCPAGTLEAGIPMTLLDPLLAERIGLQFWFKVSILVIFVGLMIPIRRPFCRTMCPLGAIYSFFNRASIFRLSVSSKCITCDRCRKVCPMDIKVYEDPNDKDCIRCLDCRKVCPVDAIEYEFAGRRSGASEPF